MLEKFQSMLRTLKKKDTKMKMSLNSVQALFNMLDMCKELKMHAITPTQVENMQSAEMHINYIIKKLYVPDYQSENI